MVEIMVMMLTRGDDTMLVENEPRALLGDDDVADREADGESCPCMSCNGSSPGVRLP